MAQVFQHIDKARDEIDADDTKEALEEVNKGREAIKAILAMLPRTTVRTRTTAPDGKVIYEDDREVQESRIPLFEGMLHTQTFAPILAARRTALEIAGVHVVESESIATEAFADLDPIEGQLGRAAKALEANKPEDAAKVLCRPWSGASSSVTVGRIRRWPRPATRSGWRGGRWRRTMPHRHWSTWKSPGGGCGSTASCCRRTSARKWTRCSARSSNWRASFARRGPSPSAAPSAPARATP